MTERFRGLMLKASSSAEGKLALRFQHKGTNHWIVPQLSASHQDTVCLQVGTVAGFTVSFLVFTSAEVKHQLRLPMDGETHKRGLASTCVLVTTQSCRHGAGASTLLSGCCHRARHAQDGRLFLWGRD